MICGYAGAVDIPVQASPNDTKIFTVALISRLSTLRVGTRYIRRGLDLEGNAANSVEMEQVVFNHDYHTDSGISSYVQLRGSAPLIWAQQRDLAYQPSIVVADVEKPEVWAAVEAHLYDLRAQYTADKSISDGKDFGKVICVNLLDDKGHEAVISKTYEQVIAKFNDAKIVYEDFPINKWCRNMDYTNMSVLVDRINDSLVNTQVFVGNGSVPSISIQPMESKTTTRPLTASKIQTGVARTSCLDSLDRTNLTCTLFARHMLAHQLLALTNPSVYSKPLPTPLSTNFATSPTTSQELESYPEIGPIRLSLSNPKSSKLFTNLWADSGDAVSLLYAGTRALRSDITRTGKRSWVHGSLDDGIN
ncbi:Phosphoinositide phosphatase sac1, partial [Rhizoclosmatium hyalinum]